MYVLFDDAGYVSNYVLMGKIVGAEEITEPEDIQAFTQHFKAYRKNGSVLVLDVEKYSELEQEKVRAELRCRRIKECFSVINRGALWLETLSSEQVEELRQWYHAWLDVTDTLVVPEKLKWLK